MLTYVHRAIVNKQFLKSFYRKNNNNILIAFFISHKSNIKTFLNEIVN